MSVLGKVDGFNDAFGEQFLKVHGARLWDMTDDDKLAAHEFRVQLYSRISTQKLNYGDGVEKAALTSVYKLFDYAREASQKHIESQNFELIVWHVLNNEVRPFTASWHLRSNAGALKALDSSDEFREDLANLQPKLVVLDAVLSLIIGRPGYNISQPADTRLAEIAAEMDQPVAWRPAGTDPLQRPQYAQDEVRDVEARRATYGIKNRDWASGLALSGGGIRSATFSLGVIASLARRGILKEIDYLSTVSGGGYTGGFLTNILGGRISSADAGLEANDEPFKHGERESDLLMGLRQRSRFLSAKFGERTILAMRATCGVFINVFVAMTVIAVFAWLNSVLRFDNTDEGRYVAAAISVGLPVLSLAILQFGYGRMPWLGWKLTVMQWVLGALFILPPLWFFVGYSHALVESLFAANTDDSVGSTSIILLVVFACLVAVLASFSTAFVRLKAPIIAAVTILLAIVAEGVFAAVMSNLTGSTLPFGHAVAVPLGMVAGVFILAWLVDINSLSLHGYYRAKLAQAFFGVTRNQDVMRLSEFKPAKAMYPIINCALNVPGSQQPAMRGRLSDVFSFTPAAAGSTVVPYQSMRDWEQANKSLDIGNLIALSGAAVSPQMGLRTTRFGSFWMTLMNVRLGAWVQKPGNAPSKPPFYYLGKEFAAMADENAPFLHLSDGGHIENLGVYELLRRRCKFIIAVDGESDPAMTFHALTNLQRLASIDFGIQIDAELDDLRLGEGGISRSHFRFCRVRYPKANGGGWEIGYLLYVKLSLTGNEGEFLRRYRLDEPSFPHHTTADQFFSETQFEAYRSLGEHIGDKLFLKAVLGNVGPTPSLEQWMAALGQGFLPSRT
ncbi:hypothetical protein [Rhizobium sp. Rhizsp82]|uniref:hypothetical protein n=1 Tax=Rhizobium sp. Rhizsp82 TaxID=3243057 RepID=UPI0039B50350